MCTYIKDSFFSNRVSLIDCCVQECSFYCWYFSSKLDSKLISIGFLNEKSSIIFLVACKAGKFCKKNKRAKELAGKPWIPVSNSRIKTITRRARYLHQTTYFCCKTTSRCQSSSVQNEDKTDLTFLLKRQNTQTSLHFLRGKNKNKLVLLTIKAQWYLAV